MQVELSAEALTKYTGGVHYCNYNSVTLKQILNQILRTLTRLTLRGVTMVMKFVQAFTTDHSQSSKDGTAG